MFDGRALAADARAARPVSVARWQYRWFLAVAVLFASQTLTRLYFFYAAFHVSRRDLPLHLALIVGFLGTTALIISRFPDRRPARTVALVLVVAILALAHAVMTLLDVSQMLMFDLTGMAAPLKLIRVNPELLLSLLFSIGLDPITVALILTGLLIAHILLYIPIAGLLVDMSRRAMSLRIMRLGGHVVSVAWVVPICVAGVSIVHQRHQLLWLQEESFDIAPAELMRAKGVPSTARQAEAVLAQARPVIVIIVDALRPDRMGVYVPSLGNTPFLSSLRDQGKLHAFGPAYSTCTFSYCGIMSVLSSHSWNNFGSRPATIVDVLGRHHYRSYLLLAGNHRHYANIAKLWGTPVVKLQNEEVRFRASDDRNVLRWLQQTRFPDPQHSFLYLHLMSVHAGSVLQPRFEQAAVGTPGLPYSRTYDGRVRQVDDIIRRIFAILRDKGLADAVIVITADHGERLGEGGKLFHGGPPDLAAIRVPLLVYDPSPAHYPEHVIASQIDAAPTLLAAVGAPIPSEWTGVALQRMTLRQAVPIGTSEETGVMASIAGKQFRYLCDRGTGRERITRAEGPEGEEIDVPIDARARKLVETLRARHKATVRPINDPKCRR